MSQRNVPALFWALVVSVLLIHNSHLWLSKRLVPDSDILALLPVGERDPVLRRAFTHMIDSAQQRLIVLVGADDWKQAGRAADAYQAVLAPHTELLQLDERISSQSHHDWLALFQQQRSTLLTPRQESALHQQPKQFWVDTALSRLYSPFGGPKLGAWQDDPFGLFGEWVQARAQETPVRPRDGRLYIGDGQRQYVVMPFTLRVPVFSMAAQQAVVPLLNQAKQSARRAAAQVQVVSAGVILYAAAAGEQASLEVSTIGLGSMLGIIVLTWITFHSFKPIALVMLSVGIGCLGALSACWLIFDRIHLLTLVFGASLIGGAQDYGTYFLCNRFAADTQQLDSWQLLRRLTPALALALVTTVIGYMGLALTPFPGLRQMAVFSAFGLIFAWLTVIFWFPTLLRGGTLKNMQLAQRYAAMMTRWPVLRYNRTMLAVAVAFIAFAAVGLSRLRVEDDIRLLQNPPQYLIDDQIKLSQLLDAPTPAQFYIVQGATADAVLQREEILKHRLDPLIERRLISGYQAISNWIPSSRTQAARHQLIERKLLNDSGPLALLAARIDEDSKWIAAVRHRLLASSLPLTADEFLRNPGSEPWRHLWLGGVAGGYASIVAVRGLSEAGLPVLQNAATGLDGVRWVDKVGEISSVLGAYRKYMGWVIAVSYIAIYGLLYPRYGGATWRVLAPTALASIATLAFLGIAGQNLQLFHVLALMLLLGIGVDYGIFLHDHSGQRDPIAWLAVALSALSTLLSFGLLSLSKTPALQAFGLTILIGTVTVWLIVPCFGNGPARKNETTEAQSRGVAQ
ncbi:MAG: MMPL family transporter [Candidatus Binatia bacterium]